jgi:hypothetical protein
VPLILRTYALLMGISPKSSAPAGGSAPRSEMGEYDRSHSPCAARWQNNLERERVCLCVSKRQRDRETERQRVRH